MDGRSSALGACAAGSLFIRRWNADTEAAIPRKKKVFSIPPFYMHLSHSTEDVVSTISMALD
ncbi:hypothetical protein QJS10_CPB15g02098 [Acorus calamus]|uniref:Uncharacterized protein n=1 Tax=Acorus calamus TaxID=4465 RepID=A0AAV9D436_ACOCL|nr:hypothetical protein QJS10_CPB15g02098 [Acorus calamus]